MCQIWIPGNPVSKGRPRVVRLKNGSTMTYTPKRTQDWEAFVKLMAYQDAPEEPWDGPVAINLRFCIERPKSVTPQKRPLPIVKPDLDNLEKAILDALNCVWYTDDSRIVRKLSEKHYVPQGKGGVAVEMQRAEVREAG